VGRPLAIDPPPVVSVFRPSVTVQPTLGVAALPPPAPPPPTLAPALPPVEAPPPPALPPAAVPPACIPPLFCPALLPPAPAVAEPPPVVAELSPAAPAPSLAGMLPLAPLTRPPLPALAPLLPDAPLAAPLPPVFDASLPAVPPLPCADCDFSAPGGSTSRHPDMASAGTKNTRVRRAAARISVLTGCPRDSRRRAAGSPFPAALGAHCFVLALSVAAPTNKR